MTLECVDRAFKIQSTKTERFLLDYLHNAGGPILDSVWLWTPARLSIIVTAHTIGSHDGTLPANFPNVMSPRGTLRNIKYASRPSTKPLLLDSPPDSFQAFSMTVHNILQTLLCASALLSITSATFTPAKRQVKQYPTDLESICGEGAQDCKNGWCCVSGTTCITALDGDGNAQCRASDDKYDVTVTVQAIDYSSGVAAYNSLNSQLSRIPEDYSRWLESVRSTTGVDPRTTAAGSASQSASGSSSEAVTSNATPGTFPTAGSASSVAAASATSTSTAGAAVRLGKKDFVVGGVMAAGAFLL